MVCACAHTLTHVSALCLVTATLSVGRYPIGNGEFFCPGARSETCYTLTCSADVIGSGSGEVGSGSGELGSGSGSGSGDMFGSDGAGSGSGSGELGSGSGSSPSGSGELGSGSGELGSGSGELGSGSGSEPSLSTFCAPPAQLLSAVVAGFVCSTGDLNSALGHTEAQCSDAGGAWNPYTCRDVANYAASQDSDTSAITSFWHGRCCSGGDLGSGSGEPGSGSGEPGSGSGESATVTLRAWTDASQRTELTDAPWPLVRATPSGCFGVPELGVFSIAVCDMENGFVWWRNFADSACTQLTWSSRGGPFGTWCFSAALPLSHLGSHVCGAYAWCAHARIRSLMFPPSASSQLR